MYFIVAGHFGSFQFGCITNSAPGNVFVHIFWWWFYFGQGLSSSNLNSAALWSDVEVSVFESRQVDFRKAGDVSASAWCSECCWSGMWNPLDVAGQKPCMISVWCGKVCSPGRGGLWFVSGRGNRREKSDPEDKCVWATLEMVRICHPPDQESGKVITQGKNQLTRPEESRKWTEE